MCVWSHIFWRQSTPFGVCMFDVSAGVWKEDNEHNVMTCFCFWRRTNKCCCAIPHDDEELPPSIKCAPLVWNLKIRPTLGTSRPQSCCYLVQKVKSALQHIVLAPWRGGPVGTLQNPLEVRSIPLAIIFCFWKRNVRSPKNIQYVWTELAIARRKDRRTFFCVRRTFFCLLFFAFFYLHSFFFPSPPSISNLTRFARINSNMWWPYIIHNICTYRHLLHNNAIQLHRTRGTSKHTHTLNEEYFYTTQ